MAVYAFGDLQGCAAPLNRLLEKIGFEPGQDRLVFAGDLVNRGPDSAGTLRRIHDLREHCQLVLGNHDIYLLARAAGVLPPKKDDTLEAVLADPQAAQWIEWLRRQDWLARVPGTDWLVVHAGIHPDWDEDTALQQAGYLHDALSGDGWRDFLRMLWAAPAPERWEDCRDEDMRQRFRAAVFTRARLMTAQDRFHWPSEAPAGKSRPWHQLYLARHPQARIVCGHWAAQGLLREERLLALDSGCVWGRQLTAAQLDSATTPAPIWQVDCASAGSRARY
ncbi:symmetrical bis(5'-nucleosyl)-tetraphosphatase [Thermithiobacillus plumbiphilus]|uniref:bis(5'-nucleosyl)-tetraphosphatase (symmetrical) n=1 Tax=Thermithiobacillus plumbiphilus TaxID=1729899 RepID=A0ABU9DBD9_9PROT